VIRNLDYQSEDHILQRIVEAAGPTFVLNGRCHSMTQGVMTYEEIAALAEVDSGRPLYYRTPTESGTIKPGGKMQIEDGMVINLGSAWPGIPFPGEAA
jgi:hypothetical protein